MRVVPNLVIDRSYCNVCAVSIVTVVVTTGSDLEPVIGSKSIGGLEWSLPNWLRDEARVGIDCPLVMVENDERLEAGDANDR